MICAIQYDHGIRSSCNAGKIIKFGTLRIVTRLTETSVDPKNHEPVLINEHEFQMSSLSQFFFRILMPVARAVKFSRPFRKNPFITALYDPKAMVM